MITDLINKGGERHFVMLEDKELGSFVNCKKLYSGEVDFAIAQNDTRISGFISADGSVVDSKIRTVLPLYPEILFIVYADSIAANDIGELVTGRRIGVGPHNSGTHRFFKPISITVASIALYTPLYIPHGLKTLYPKTSISV
ncbi:MAG TPA: TAXI family TRAP transporter solute-binding subunit [Bacteroidales bacterium]|nr:TAXI family TRAP transporter solute-binding subunit [Bacteroidales bacterium]